MSHLTVALRDMPGSEAPTGRRARLKLKLCMRCAQVAALAEAAGVEVDPKKPYAELWCAPDLS